MQKSAKQVPGEKQVAIAELPGVKPLLMKGADDDGDEHDAGHADGEKVMGITITASTTCTFGYPQR